VLVAASPAVWQSEHSTKEKRRSRMELASVFEQILDQIMVESFRSYPKRRQRATSNVPDSRAKALTAEPGSISGALPLVTAAISVPAKPNMSVRIIVGFFTKSSRFNGEPDAPATGLKQLKRLFSIIQSH
jgi:hypothetical protein